MKSRFVIVYMLLSLSLVLLAGCSTRESTSSAGDSGKLRVYTSFYTMHDFVQKIGGDRIKLTNLVPAGTEPHDWEPSAKDMAGLGKADLLIYNGAGMEGWLEKVVKSLGNKELVLVEAAKGIKLLEGSQHEELEYDPHVWLNPLLAKQQMAVIKDALSAADPSNKEFYEMNFTEQAGKLEELDREFKNSLAQYTHKEIVVAHQAFGYLCKAYGLKQIAIEGLNADSEPTPSKMAEVATFAKENGVKVIFFEELLNPKIAKTIAEEAGAETEVLNPLEGLKEEDIKGGKDYFSVMRENLKALKKALK
jgi:zinc transport system substrate-binding protein